MRIPVIEECKCGEDALLECVNGVFIVSCKNCNTHTGYYDGATETIEVWNKETNKANSGKSTPTSHSEATNLAQRISDGLVLLRENGF